jgi:hypothetical protein
VRKLFFATAIAALATAPALAQQVAPAPTQPYQSSWTNEYGATWEDRAPRYGMISAPYAYTGAPYASVNAGPFAMQAPVAPSAPVAVSIDGRYLGADPDPFIRHSLIRDQDQILGTGPN